MGAAEIEGVEGQVALVERLAVADRAATGAIGQQGSAAGAGRDRGIRAVSAATGGGHDGLAEGAGVDGADGGTGGRSRRGATVLIVHDLMVTDVVLGAVFERVNRTEVERDGIVIFVVEGGGDAVAVTLDEEVVVFRVLVGEDRGAGSGQVQVFIEANLRDKRE